MNNVVFIVIVANVLLFPIPLKAWNLAGSIFDLDSWSSLIFDSIFDCDQSGPSFAVNYKHNRTQNWTGWKNNEPAATKIMATRKMGMPDLLLSVEKVLTTIKKQFSATKLRQTIFIVWVNVSFRIRELSSEISIFLCYSMWTFQV